MPAANADPAYLDAAAAVPMHPAAREALLASLDDGWADPGKLYAQARRARHLLDAARAATADTLGVREDEITFCASGSDACQLGVAGLALARRRVGAAVVHSAVEHSAILRAAGRYGEAVPVGVDLLGRVDLEAFTAAVARPGVAAAALMSANHEVGTAQPVGEAATACARYGVPLLVDAAQSIAWTGVPPGWSVLVASARKWGGPPGAGVLVVRTGTRFTLADPATAPASLPLVVAAAVALRAARAEAPAQGVRLRALVDRIRREVPARIPGVEVVGDPDQRLPHICTFSFLYVDGEALLHALDARGFAVSSGSSCTSDSLRPSHVLEAMGVLSHGNVRISLHRETTDEQVTRLLAELPDIVAGLREQVGVSL